MARGKRERLASQEHIRPIHAQYQTVYTLQKAQSCQTYLHSLPELVWLVIECGVNADDYAPKPYQPQGHVQHE